MEAPAIDSAMSCFRWWSTRAATSNPAVVASRACQRTAPPVFEASALVMEVIRGVAFSSVGARRSLRFAHAGRIRGRVVNTARTCASASLSEPLPRQHPAVAAPPAPRCRPRHRSSPRPRTRLRQTCASATPAPRLVAPSPFRRSRTSKTSKTKTRTHRRGSKASWACLRSVYSHQARGARRGSAPTRQRNTVRCAGFLRRSKMEKSSANDICYAC